MERVKAGNSRDQSKKDEEKVIVEMRREIIWIFAVGINLSFSHGAATRTHDLS